jgi:hypothetical protein
MLEPALSGGVFSLVAGHCFFSCVSSVSWLTLLRLLCQQDRGISRQAANPQPDRKEEDLTTERTESTEGMRASRPGGATRRDVNPCRGWPAFHFRVLPFLPWTILFNDGLGFATTVEQEQRLRRALTPKSNPNASSSNFLRLLPFFRVFRVFRG